jgi:hypothetical protein
MSGCQPKLYRVRQVLAELEPECFGQIPLGSTSGGVEIGISPTADADIQMNERDVARRTLTNLQSIVGARKGMIKFSAEFKGNGASVGGAINKPAFSKYLIGCCMEERSVKAIAVVPKTSGDRKDIPALYVAEQGAGPTLKRALVVISFNSQRDTKIYYEQVKVVATDVSDSFVAGDIVIKPAIGGATYATLTASGVEIEGAGYSYTPTTDNQKQLTIRSEEDGFKKEIYSAMGNVTINAESSGIAKLEFDFQGVIAKYRRAMVKDIQAVGIGEGNLIQTSGGAKKAILRQKIDPLNFYKLILNGTTSFEFEKQTAPYAPASSDITEIMYELIDGSADFVEGDVLLQADGVAEVATLITPASDLIGFTDLPVTWGAGFGDRPMTKGVEFSEEIPPTLQDAGLFLEVDGVKYKPTFSSVSVACGNEVIVRVDGNSPTGLKGAQVTSRKPTASCDPEMMSEEDFDVFGTWFDGETARLEFKISRNEVGNRLFFVGKKAQFQSVQDGERDSISTAQLEMNLVGDTSDVDDEYKIVIY